jgi:hypothetical protein
MVNGLLKGGKKSAIKKGLIVQMIRIIFLITE